MGDNYIGGISPYELAKEFGEESIYKIIELAVKYHKLIARHCDETLTNY